MMTFEALSTKRRDYVEAARANGFEEGLRRLLADLYPDNAHFIYELLQNAEDAGAREVKFGLQPDGLKFEHDGTRLFDLENIKSITGIGQSTKANDATSIGKFGVGFKAVFAYTQTPVIHSGVHSFEIQDLFVPSRVPPEARNGWTTFWFPFNHADKPANRAVKEVEGALRDISRTTLLFLNNIRLIACSMPDGGDRLLERHALDEHVIAIESLHEEELSYWYRIAGDVTIEGKGYPAAAAFALEARASKQGNLKKSNGYSVKPVDGQVFIYFPAVKETSGLKFHIHAPFASTVARDSVRDTPENDMLVEGIADLIIDALPKMCQDGMVTTGFLSALPNANDDLSERYSVLRKRLVTAFGTNCIAPMVDRGHGPAHELLRSDRSIRSALSVDEANFLRRLNGEKPASGWLADREGRAGAFLGSLNALDFGRDELSAILERLGEIHSDESIYGDDPDFIDDEDREDLEAWYDWISERTDVWLRDFYVMLETLAPKARTYNYFEDQARADFLASLAAAPLVRIQEGKGVCHVPGPQAHLPTSAGLRADGLVVDPLAVFETDDNYDDLELLQGFYRHAGVKPWDAAAQLDARFSSYNLQRAAVTDQHLEDLRTLAQLIEEKAVSPSTYARRPILVAIRRDGTCYWEKPLSIYLDAPFGSTGLSSLFDSEEYPGTPPGRLDASYLETSPEIAVLVGSLGAIQGLRIAPTRVKDNPQFAWGWVERENHNKIEVDWHIPHFDVIVSCGDDTLHRALWTIIASAPSSYADAIYRSNGSSRKYAIKSQLLQQITSAPWILDSDGNLRLPADVSGGELADNLPEPVALGLLTLASFGQKAAVDAIQLKRQDEVAKKLGFGSIEEMQRIADLHRRNPEKFKSLLDHMETEVRLPDNPTMVLEERAKRANLLSGDAPMRKYEKRVRSVFVREAGHLSASRGYLVRLYTNDDGILVCQICASRMPFKISGEYFFVAVQFITGVQRDLRENRLALCPVCAAKYSYARDTSLEDLRDDLLTQSVGYQGSITVDVQLAGEPAKIRFVGKHAIDLQSVLSATEGERLEDGENEDIYEESG